MNDPTARLLVVVAVVLVAVLVALVTRRFRRPTHPDVTVGDIGDRPGVVLFTSTGCSICKKAIAALEAEAVTFREVTYDLEPHRFESWVVLAVPLTVVVDAQGTVIATLSGLPERRALRRALRRAGIEAA